MHINGSDEIGSVSNLTPLTTYNCSIHAVTQFGGPKSDNITVTTNSEGTNDF